MSNNPYSVGQRLSSGHQQQPTSVRSMQIVAAALIAGLLMFGGLVLVMTNADFSGKPGPMAFVGIGFAVVAIVNYFLIPSLMTKRHWKMAISEGVLNQPDEVKTQRGMMIYQAQMIVAMAILEGAGFCNLTVAIVEHNPVNPGVALALVGLMLLKFPTQTKVTWWIEEQLREAAL